MKIKLQELRICSLKLRSSLTPLAKGGIAIVAFLTQLGDLNRVSPKVIEKTLIASLTGLALFSPSQTNAQILPQPWVSVGSEDGDVTFSVGAKIIGLGVELGFGPDGSTGVDVLKFINLPVIAPYVGIGLYSDDEDVAFSGGVQVGASDNLFLGVGYNSVRGVNGQIGVRF